MKKTVWIALSSSRDSSRDNSQCGGLLSKIGDNCDRAANNFCGNFFSTEISQAILTRTRNSLFQMSKTLDLFPRCFFSFFWRIRCFSADPDRSAELGGFKKKFRKKKIRRRNPPGKKMAYLKTAIWSFLNPPSFFVFFLGGFYFGGFHCEIRRT